MAVETFDPRTSFGTPEMRGSLHAPEQDDANPDTGEELDNQDSLTGRSMRRVANFLNDKAESADSRAERNRDRIETAKESIRGFGRSALNILRKTGRISANVGITTLGVGMIAGQAAGRGIARGARAVSEATMNATDSVVGFVDDKVDQVTTTAKNTVESVKNTYSDTKVSLNNTYTEAKWRAGSAVENGIQSVKNRAEVAAFDARTKLKETYSLSNARENIRNSVESTKAGAHDMAFEFGMMRKAYKEKATAALTRRMERIRAFKNRGVEQAVAFKDAGVEKFNDTRDRTSRRAKRIGHGAMTFASVASESGQAAIDNFSSRMKSLKDDEATLNGSK